MRYFIELSYFGKPYHGWQKQPNAITVQQTLEEALSVILRNPLTVMGAGRTDTGVHAAQMYAHFDLENEKESFKAAGIDDLNMLTHKLDRYLPASIAIKSIVEVASEAHARFDATARSYRYIISKQKNPFTANLAYRCNYELDLKAMEEAAKIILDYSDFECFSKSKTEVNNYLCQVTESYWEETATEYQFVITANRFLRNMVRAIVGTLIEIGRGKQDVSWMHEVIQAKNRSVAGSSAPAHGLYLEKVVYPPSTIK